jgi:hypothetical protein
MPDADYQLLLNWFINIVNGMEEEFELEDDLGDTYTVRFIEPEIDASLTAFSLWDVSFPLEEVTV